MPPQQLDQDVVRLAKSIRRIESGDNPQARGGSGEFGAYQYTPATWAAHARAAGVTVPLEQASIEDQNKVFYTWAKSKKDSGANIGQIASMHNAGEGRPDAYIEGNKGTNKYGVAYDTKSYAEKVAQLYQQMKQEEPRGAGYVTPPTVEPGPVSQETTGPEIEKKGGLLGDIARGIASPVLNLLARPGQAVARAAGYEGNLSGEFTPFGLHTGIEITEPKSYGDVVKDVGRGLETVALGVGGGAVKSLATNTLKGAFKQGAIQGIKGGALTGAMTGAGSTLENRGTDTTTTQLAANTLAGGAIGGITGGVLGGVGAGAGNLIGRKIPSRIIENRYNELVNIEKNNAKIRKVIEAGDRKGIDTKRILADSDLLVGSVDENGTINTQNAIAQMQEFLQPKEQVIRGNLEREGRLINLVEVEKRLKDAVKKSGVEGGALKRALAAVDDDIEGYALRADKDGNIPLTLIHDAKVDKYSRIDYANPDSKAIDKAIAKALKRIVEDETKSIDVKEINKELSDYFATLSVLEKLDGAKVQGGRLGKYFAQTVGSIAGSSLSGLGPLGPILGAEAGGYTMGKLMSSKFGSKTGAAFKDSPAMQRAVELSKLKKLNVKQLPSEWSLGTIDAGKKARRKSDGLPAIKF